MKFKERPKNGLYRQCLLTGIFLCFFNSQHRWAPCHGTHCSVAFQYYYSQLSSPVWLKSNPVVFNFCHRFLTCRDAELVRNRGRVMSKDHMSVKSKCRTFSEEVLCRHNTIRLFTKSAHRAYLFVLFIFMVC